MLKRCFFSQLSNLIVNCEENQATQKYDTKKCKCKYNLSKLIQCSFVYSLFFAPYAHYKLDNKLLISARTEILKYGFLKHEIRKQRKKIKSKPHANKQRAQKCSTQS